MIVKGHLVEMRVEVSTFIVPPCKEILVIDLFECCLKVSSDLVDLILDSQKGLQRGEIVKNISSVLLGRFILQMIPMSTLS